MYPKPFKKIIQAPSTKFTHTFNRPVRSPANFTPWELDKNEYPAASKLQDVFSHHNYSSNPTMNPNYFSDSVLDIPDIEAYTEIVTKQGFIDGRIPDDEVIENIEKIEKPEEEVKHIKVVMTQRSNSITHDNIPPQTDYTTNVQTQQSDIGAKANKQAKTVQNNGEKTLPTVRTERKRHVSRHSTDFKSKASCIALGSTRSHLRNSSLTKEIAELKAELLQEREKTPPKKQKESLLKLDRTISGNQVPSDKVIELSSMFGVEVSAVINERKKLIKENVVLKAVENIKEKKDKGHRTSQLLPALAVLNNGHSSRRIYQSVERDNTKRETTELPKSQIPATVKLANPVKEAKERTNAYFSVERERPPMHSRARSRELKTVTLSLENKGAEQASELLREKTPAHQRQQHPSPPPHQQNSERFYLYRINMLSSRLNPGVAKTFDDIGMRASEARGSLEPIYKESSVERIKRIEGEGSPDNSGDLSPKPGANKGMSIMSLKLWKKQMESVARPIFFGPNKVPVYMNEKKKFLPTEVINGFPGGKKIKHMRGKKELRPTFSTQNL